MHSKREQAWEIFDVYNAQDPTVFVWEGRRYAQALFMAKKLCEWVVTIAPDASEALMLAARCQHIGRWEMPRKDFPEGRIGYLAWRKALMRFHADKAADILTRVGYGDADIDQVTAIVMKKDVQRNADVQTIENALCLVFLEYQYEAFHAHNTEKIVHILKKSLMKMDAVGHQHALTLYYSPVGMGYIEQALAQMQEEMQATLKSPVQ